MSVHVYFDLDGTLTDPYEGITNCILYAVDALGFERPADGWLRRAIGPPLWDTFPVLVGADLTPRAVELYRERFDDIGWQENTPYEGIRDALHDVQKSGARMFVATSKPHAAARRIVEHFRMAEFFDAVYGSELDGTRSDKAELLQYAIQNQSTAAYRFMVGDRMHDIVGAQANGVTPIGVSYGYGGVDELHAAGAVAVVDSPRGIPAVLV